MPKLVKLFNNANQEVQRHATGAMRNLIYDNAENKLALVEENGIYELLRTLHEQDDELRKNVTGEKAFLRVSSGPNKKVWRTFSVTHCIEERHCIVHFPIPTLKYWLPLERKGKVSTKWPQSQCKAI